MTKLTTLIGLVLLTSAGIAVSVLGQVQSGQKKPSADSVPLAQTKPNPLASAPAPLFEYEIRIWKDGAPATPTMKLKARGDEISELKIPEGTFELRFRPNGDSVNSEAQLALWKEQAQRLAKQRIDTQLEIFILEADIKAMEDAKRMGDDEERLNHTNEQLEQQIRDEFRKDPEVIALNEDIAIAAEQRDHARKIAREGNDPARRASEQKYQKLMLQYAELWKVKYDAIGKRLRTTSVSPSKAKSIADLKQQLAALKAQQAKQSELFEKLKVEFRDRRTK